MTTTHTPARRAASLMPSGIPRYIRCYDNGGESLDRYTVVFTGNYRSKTGGDFLYIGMNDSPFHPQGVGMHGGHKEQIDRPGYGHLGKKISFQQLPDDCRALVLRDYCDLWDLKTAKAKGEIV